MQDYSPEQSMWKIRREFGEHGGVSLSIFRSSTFTVMDPSLMPDIFKGVRGPDKVRMKKHSRRASAIAELLERLKVKVTYPGLPSHPQYELLNSMTNRGFGRGGILSIGVTGNLEACMEQMERALKEIGLV